MKRLIIIIFISLLLVACQQNSESSEQVDEMAEALKSFEAGNPDKPSEYLGTWSTYAGEGTSYKQIQLFEEEGQYQIQYDVIDHDGRILNSMLGPLEGLEDGVGAFDYDSDRYGNNGVLEVHLEQEGIQFNNRIDGTNVEEVFFEQKISR
ncbi:hypothetical protein [Alkalibacillus salilacus]|uniref:Uncharacterized protein n=1 Tax=Alkalibacillus salilacus TaxID=284582 RepID=A0ABT9VH01_9BACI|nr:hypothetical protein [Alkalibacillus salilacus]MDQ0160239.1 hypothetical protein [Alkalibacillus salilacus]